MKKGKTVILAAGDFPRAGGVARRILESAARVVCCDSAATSYRRHLKRDPDVIIGDLDSLKTGAACQTLGANFGEEVRIVHVPEQETNDLEKALIYCRARGWSDLVIVGAAGKREDHTLSNVFRALAYGVECVTDFGRFVPVASRATFRVEKGAAMSVFAPDPATRMTSKGLVWPLDGVRFKNLYCATLNRASGVRVSLTTTRPVLVYLPFP